MRRIVFGLAAVFALVTTQGQDASAQVGVPIQQPAGGTTSGSGNSGRSGAQSARNIHVIPLTGIIEPINVVRLSELRARQPKACGPTEVSPGVWVRIDCHLDATPMLKARSHYSAAKLRMAKQGKLSFRPIKGKRFSRGGGSLGVPMGGGATPSPPPSPATPRGVSPPQGAGGGERAGVRPGSDGPTVGGQGGGERAPASVDHRADNLEGPVKNQGYVGSCTAASLSAALDNAIRRAGKQDVSSISHIWSFYAVPKMGTAGDSNLGQTIAKWDTWPYSGKEACKMSDPRYEDCGEAYGVRPGTARQDPTYVANLNKATQNGAFKISAIEALKTLPANPEELTTALASGADLWIAMKIDGAKWSNNKMKNFAIPDWTSAEVSGGHAVTMSGYRDTPTGRQYLIHNSWGESWGDRGYAWVSERMVQNFMHYAFRVKLEGQGAPAELTDDDCGADELIDASTGQCATICPDDSRPDNGCGASSKRR